MRVVQHVKRVEVISPPKLYSSEGTVFYRDDMEGTVKFSTGTQDTTAQTVAEGSNSLKITSAGSSPWKTNATCKVIPVNPDILSTKLGIEFMLRLEKINTTEIAAVRLSLDLMDGTTQYVPQIKWLSVTATTGKLQYADNAGAFQDVSGGTVNLEVGYFYRVKLVLDLDSKEYVSLTVGSQVFDLSGIGLYNTADTKAPRMILGIENEGIDATTENIWIDALTLTTNEP